MLDQCSRSRNKGGKPALSLNDGYRVLVIGDAETRVHKMLLILNGLAQLPDRPCFFGPMTGLGIVYMRCTRLARNGASAPKPTECKPARRTSFEARIAPRISVALSASRLAPLFTPHLYRRAPHPISVCACVAGLQHQLVSRSRHKFSLPAHFRPSGPLALSVPRMPDLGDHLRRGAAGPAETRSGCCLLRGKRHGNPRHQQVDYLPQSFNAFCSRQSVAAKDLPAPNRRAAVERVLLFGLASDRLPARPLSRWRDEIRLHRYAGIVEALIRAGNQGAGRPAAPSFRQQTPRVLCGKENAGDGHRTH